MAYPFRQARNYQPANRQKGDVWWIVLHSAETGEGDNTAKAIADYFATTDRKASAHYQVDGGPDDGNQIYQSVREKDVAYGAKSANAKGIHIEQAGRAAQTREQWLDPYSKRMIKRVAGLINEIAERWTIPLVFVDSNGLKAGKRGITTHNEVNKAWPSSGHTDPGQNYPLDVLFADLASPVPPSQPDILEELMAQLTPEEITQFKNMLKDYGKLSESVKRGWDSNTNASVFQYVISNFNWLRKLLAHFNIPE